MNKRKVPKIRFKGFYDDWEQRKLEDYLTVSVEKNTGNIYGRSDVLSVSGDYGIVNQIEFQGRSFAGASVSNYGVVQTGDVVYTKSPLNSNPYGIIKTNKGKPGIVSTLYAVYHPRENAFSDFIQEYFEQHARMNNYMHPLVNKGAKNDMKVSAENALKGSVCFPSRIEQKSISAFFSALDRLITLHQRKLELLERLRNSLVDRCFIGEKYTMSKLILYHGSPNRVIVPKFGFGEDRHDYGRGFYLTENLELAKEWAVCRPDETNGWVHKYELEMDGLNILDFQKYDVLSWLAELMKHRDAADSRRYKMLAQKFIEKYGIDTCGYDVITGWRANASYFYIAKEFVRDNIDIEILEELLSLGGLGIQFCIKSERAFEQLSEVEQDIMSVDYSEFNDRYNERDINARNKMRALVDSDANKVTHVFSTLFER